MELLQLFRRQAIDTVSAIAACFQTGIDEWNPRRRAGTIDFAAAIAQNRYLIRRRAWPHAKPRMTGSCKEQQLHPDEWLPYS